MKKTKIKICMIMVLLLLITFLLCVSIRLYQIQIVPTSMVAKRINEVDIAIDKLVTTKQSLIDQINAYLFKNNITDNIAIYVSDFKGMTYEHNIDSNFLAASIYKVPLAMIYYERIHNGDISYNDVLQYQAYEYEAGGVLGAHYQVGSYITISTLLHDMILYSDNTAAHILYENLGGWINFKKAIVKFSNNVPDKYFFTYDNVFTASYMGDVMNYIYQHHFEFDELLKDMSKPASADYLSTYVNTNIAQKYGLYEQSVNSVGLVSAKTPYSIVIFTTLGETGSTHIGKINQICYRFFNAK